MIKIINTVLASQSLPGVRAGRIVPRGRPVLAGTAAEAMQTFLAFGGEGWLCTAELKQILHTAAGGAWLPPVTAWPLHGELANGNHSLHLRRTPQGWMLVTLEEIPPPGGDCLGACLVDTTLHSHLNNLLLRYTVAWTPVALGRMPRESDSHSGHTELRATASRFSGFSTVP